MAERKSKDQEKFQRDVQDLQEAWKEFAKESKKAQYTVIVVYGVILAVAVGLLRWLLI